MKIETTTTKSIALGEGAKAMHVTLTVDGDGQVQSLSASWGDGEHATIDAETFDRIAAAVDAHRSAVSVYPRYIKPPEVCADHGYYGGGGCAQCASAESSESVKAA